MKIPKYIEEYIFTELNGFYETGTDIDTNIDNNDNDNKRYLGTYFPRSLIESYTILMDIYENEKIKEAINKLEQINILDFGTGTGGNIIGLMHFFKNIKFPTEKVQFVTIEGNKNAIEYQVKLFNKFNSKFNTKFKLIYATKKFSINNIEVEGRSLINQIKTKYNIEKYDFITTFKFISEFYNSNFQLANSQQMFKKFLKFNEKFLNNNGIILMLDLVSGNFDRNNPRPYTTQIMSNETKGYIKGDNGMKILLPASCAHWANICNSNDCYIQRTFKIEHSHTKYANDLSNVSYYIFVKTDFANSILNSITIKNSYKISHNRFHPGYCNLSNRLEGNTSELPDGFKIN